MTNDKVNYIIFPIVLMFITWTVSCSGRSGNKSTEDIPLNAAKTENAEEKLIKMVLPEQNAVFKLHQPVRVVLELESRYKVPDSVLISYDGKMVKKLVSEPWEYSIPADYTVATGRKSIKLSAYRGGKSQIPVTRFMIIYSDVVPKRFHYKVVNTFPHDKKAFTQGLIYDNGILYESTGQETESSLREVDLATGKVLRQLNLESSLFGEGITIWRDRIFHITWKSKVGFVYDRSTFRLINKIYYQTEGWGLTTIDDKLVMSDGTNVLGFYDPESFTVISRIEVFDNEKKIDSLNELEFINGEIWANIWMSDLIARIDPGSGKVIAYIDLQGLLPDSEKTGDSSVLNGIAWDKKGKRIFVTGKNWPRLYEIAITP
jgi:glutaminyl-peptide cyclotransferase